MRVTEGPSGHKDGEGSGWENASSAASRFGRRTSQQQEKQERAPRQDCAWLFGEEQGGQGGYSKASKWERAEAEFGEVGL